MPPRIAINFDPNFPSSNLANQAFELIAVDGCDVAFDSVSQIGQERCKGGSFPAWIIGRHPQWCDFVAESECRALSVIHLTIAYNRALDCWMILDGGVYPESIKYRGRRDKKHPDLSKPPGYGASSYGVWLNNYRIPTKNFEPICPGDRILLDDAFKIIVSENLYSTIGPEQWRGYWKDEPIDETRVDVRDVESTLRDQVEEHEKQSSKKSLTWPDIVDKILNGPDDIPNKYWWIFLFCLGAFVFYTWAKYLQN